MKSHERLLTVYQSCRWDNAHRTLRKWSVSTHAATTKFTMLCLTAFTDFTFQWLIGRVAWFVLAAAYLRHKGYDPSLVLGASRAQKAPDLFAPCTCGKVASITLICQELSCILPGSPCSTLASVPACTAGKSGSEDHLRPDLKMQWAPVWAGTSILGQWLSLSSLSPSSFPAAASET